jgi:hypothetical protein
MLSRCTDHITAQIVKPYSDLVFFLGLSSLLTRPSPPPRVNIDSCLSRSLRSKADKGPFMHPVLRVAKCRSLEALSLFIMAWLRLKSSSELAYCQRYIHSLQLQQASPFT